MKHMIYRDLLFNNWQNDKMNFKKKLTEKTLLQIIKQKLLKYKIRRYINLSLSLET